MVDFELHHVSVAVPAIVVGVRARRPFLETCMITVDIFEISTGLFSRFRLLLAFITCFQ